MKRKFFTFASVAFLILSGASAKAQYCFWVANQSNETFYQLRVRVNGSGRPFGPDLLPEDLIEPGKHFWVRTANNGEEIYDVQITRAGGRPLLFTYTDVGGKKHISQRFITANARRLHTLVIQGDDEDNLSFSYYTTDQLDYGDPCNN